MTQQQLLAKCSERDQAFSDGFHQNLDIKSFTDLIDPDKVPYTSLVDYHLVINRHKDVFHQFILEARSFEDAENFYKYLRDEIIEPGTITGYYFVNLCDSGFGYYLLTVVIS